VRRRSALRDRVEFILARSTLLAARVVPAGALGALAAALGFVLALVLTGRRRQVAENRLLARRLAGRLPSPFRLAASSLASLCRSFLEADRIPLDPAEARRLLRIADPERFQELREHLARGPVVLATAHFGAYEILGAVAPLHGVPVLTMVRPLDNSLLEAYLQGCRERQGQALLGNRGGVAGLFEALVQGRSVALLIDLDGRSHGRFVDFLGTPASTLRTAAVLALRANRPLVPVFARRPEGPGAARVEISDPLLPRPEAAREEEIQRLLQLATDALAERIDRSPEQWMWTHRRWKTRPPEARDPACPSTRPSSPAGSPAFPAGASSSPAT
jgi:KDO2-lipid IV(A) lauroyltransferase